MTDWTLAACVGRDLSLFFPNTPGNSLEPAAAAAVICRACPIQAACLEHALETDERYGIWGGFTWEQRQRIKQGLPVRTHSPSVDGHGYFRYRKGCRCDVCKAANTTHHRKYQRREKRCVQCGELLEGRGRHRYCSQRCRRLYASKDSRQGADA
jgi:WhiB family transcriptional regulator, redox-sensing transcriptional regulator